jgi:two-component system, NarL family, nitrate/nitrite response regulator NarL
MSRTRREVAVAIGNIRVLIIEDHAIVRAGIRMLVERDSHIEVVAEAATATEALAHAGNISTDVILLDISLRSQNGVELIPQLLHDFQPAKVLILTAVEDVETHLLAMEEGAGGVVMKDQAPEILAKAIEAVSRGEPWIGQAISVAALNKLARVKTAKEKLEPDAAKIALLTPREREVVAAVARGLSGPRIGEELNIADATVRHHITSIFGKLEVSNRLELAVYAFNHGLGPDMNRQSVVQRN